jgi:hypothetical protein
MAVNPVKTPFTNMSFTPDVPSSALTPNEYNVGQNIETNTRGINSVAGDEYILSQVPGTVIYVDSGFRENDVYWFIVATLSGVWYGINSAGITNLSSGAVGYNGSGYTAATAITSSWNGNVLFINDGINPPMYLLPQYNTLRLYDNAPDNYIWNYDVTTDTFGNIVPLYSSLTSAFMRVYNSPNVGSLLVAGNLTGNVINGPYTGTTQNLPTTVRWSQNFGLNSGPTTWSPTITNIANEVEFPVRGPVVDGFPLNGNFYVCSYWDICVMSPIAYQNSTTPVFGIKIVNQGRGLLNENCWSNVDNTVYGLDARDIWSFDGGNFKPIGNQRVKDYFFANLNPNYTDQLFMDHNSSKYQIEIYYPDLNSTGYCNKMISYRYDLDVWQPPRDVTLAAQSTEAPNWTGTQFNLASRDIVYASAQGNVQLVQKDQGTSFLGNAAISTLFQRNNISFGQPYSASVQVHRVLPEVYGTGNIQITVGGADSVASAPVYKPTQTMDIVTDNPWVQINQNEARVTTVQVASNTATTSWQMTAANWQVTVVQDTR